MRIDSQHILFIKLFIYYIYMTNIEFFFIVALFIILVISFYFFIDCMVLKKKQYSNIFTTWQFPMLFAIFLDAIYYYY